MKPKEARRIVLNRILEVKFQGKKSELARAIGEADSYLWQLLEGRRTISEDRARNIEKRFGMPQWSMDDPQFHFDETGLPVRQDAAHYANVVVVERLNVAGSMGPGEEHPDREAVVDHIRLSFGWLSSHLGPLSQVTNLRVISAYGDSMMPTFNDGDLLLVDTGVRAVDIDGVFVLRAHGRLYIKRVRQRPTDGVYIISSDNPAVGAQDELSGNHQVEVLGRVLWAWNGKKL